MVKLRGREQYPFYYGATPQLLKRAGELRRNMTPAEKILWQALGDRKAEGFKFRRQHPISTFIVDFFCYEAKLVLELDGSVHNDQSQHERDIERTRILNELGLRIIRFTNSEIENNLPIVISKIIEALNNS